MKFDKKKRPSNIAMTLMTSFGGDAIVRASRNHAVSVREEGDRARSYLHVFTPFFLISNFLDKRSPATSWWNPDQ